MGLEIRVCGKGSFPLQEERERKTNQIMRLLTNVYGILDIDNHFMIFFLIHPPQQKIIKLLRILPAVVRC